MHKRVERQRLKASAMDRNLEEEIIALYYYYYHCIIHQLKLCKKNSLNQITSALITFKSTKQIVHRINTPSKSTSSDRWITSSLLPTQIQGQYYFWIIIRPPSPALPSASSLHSAGSQRYHGLYTSICIGTYQSAIMQLDPTLFYINWSAIMQI